MMSELSEKGFVTISYIGSEIADFFVDPERPPRSAKLVASLSWAWGPTHGRYSSYLLRTDRNRSSWYLWDQGVDPDSGRKMYRRVASGSPYREISARQAAEKLLIASWLGEIEFEYAELQGVYVEEEGLPNKRDIERIQRTYLNDLLVND